MQLNDFLVEKMVENLRLVRASTWNILRVVYSWFTHGTFDHLMNFFVKS